MQFTFLVRYEDFSKVEAICSDMKDHLLNTEGIHRQLPMWVGFTGVEGNACNVYTIVSHHLLSSSLKCCLRCLHLFKPPSCLLLDRSGRIIASCFKYCFWVTCMCDMYCLCLGGGGGQGQVYLLALLPWWLHECALSCMPDGCQMHSAQPVMHCTEASLMHWIPDPHREAQYTSPLRFFYHPCTFVNQCQKAQSLLFFFLISDAITQDCTDSQSLVTCLEDFVTDAICNHCAEAV